MICIKKLVKRKNKYYLQLEDEQLEVHESTLIKLNLFSNVDVSKAEVKYWNDYYYDLDKCLKLLKKKMVSEAKIRRLLKDSIHLEELLEFLYENNLLNDYIYCENYISSRMSNVKYSCRKFIQELSLDEIDREMVTAVLLKFEFSELDNALKLCEKKKRTYRFESAYMIKMKLRQYLMQHQFANETIAEVVDFLEIDELDNARAYATKLQRLQKDITKELWKKKFTRETIREIEERWELNV